MSGFGEALLLELRNHEIQTLNELGLSVLQARAYLALIRLGSAKVKTIAKFSSVARSDLYRTLTSLQELGLVEKVIAAPLQFRAIPLDQGLLLLLKSRTKEEKKIRSKTLQLIREFKASSKAVSSEADDSKFVLVPSGNLLLEKVSAAIAQSHMHIDLLVSWKQFSPGINDAFTESVDDALSRNVKFRLIVEATAKASDTKRLAQLCKKKPDCQFRFIPKSPDYVFGVFDKKRVLLIVDPEATMADSPAFWTNNKSLVSLIHDYFEMLWFISSEKLYFDQAVSKPSFGDLKNKKVMQAQS